MSAGALPQPPASGVTPTLAQRLAAWVNARSTAGRQFVRGAYTITVVDDLVCTVTASNRVSVTMNLRVQLAGADVTPAGLNPVTIVNPPLYVRNADGTLTQDVAQAFRVIVLDLLKSYR